MRYRWFESISLQRRVGCEPDPEPFRHTSRKSRALPAILVRNCQQPQKFCGVPMVRIDLPPAGNWCGLYAGDSSHSGRRGGRHPTRRTRALFPPDRRNLATYLIEAVACPRRRNRRWPAANFGRASQRGKISCRTHTPRRTSCSRGSRCGAGGAHALELPRAVADGKERHFDDTIEAIDVSAREGLHGADAGRRLQANPKALRVLVAHTVPGHARLASHELEEPLTREWALEPAEARASGAEAMIAHMNRHSPPYLRHCLVSLIVRAALRRSRYAPQLSGQRGRVRPDRHR